MLIAKLSDTAELRTLELFDVDALFALAQANLDRNYWLPRTLQRSDIESRVTSGLEIVAKQEGLLGGIFERGALCGVAAIWRYAAETRSIEIGYWIGQHAEGRGLVKRACRAVMRHAFETLKVHRIELRCHAENVRSVALAERLGFRREGCFVRAERLGESWVDLLVYGMLEDEWRDCDAARATD
ncbi:MAG: GNAT family N-acetyltransferase [Planctomycetes bacterium]|nr:GNAT family N-acetyltransferase [Planctomycetota bacterium]MCC7173291.1 GNAT family N-acetyltransferase [Planctomycetota bacterium]